MIFSALVSRLRRRSRGTVRSDHSDVSNVSVLNGDSGLTLSAPDDSGIGLEHRVDTDTVDNNLMNRAVARLGNANGNLAGEVYSFMRDNVFGSDNLDYRNIGATAAYLESLATHADGEASRAIETARTVISYLDQYSKKGGTSVKGFRKALFGEKGVLTRKRLKDMKKVTKYVANNATDLDQRTNHRMTVGSNLDVLNVSYTTDRNGKALVNVNQDNSSGMSTGAGNVYWSAFDSMFAEDADTKSAVTRYVKRAIVEDHQDGGAEILKRNDWKKNELRDYARYLK